jgi:lipopolysaccharide/colanic/teichoic acid biosynthesis glycosyltransferase
MGGMSSLSYDSVFSPDSENQSDPVHQLGPAVDGHRAARAWDLRHSGAAPAARTAGEAGPWVLSATRRILDFTVALAALTVLLPLMLIAGALVRFGSGGPVFFRQRRMGRNGREFTLYKFRSMKPENGAGSSITVIGDSRITPVGGFLRRYKLDELPQFWNVLTGDMSLVGPRPKLPHHEALHMCCRPGITGVATLAFHKEEEFLSGIPEHELEAFYEVFVKPAKARLDLDYMRTATLASDIDVLWRTASSCIFGSKESLALPAEIVAQYASRRKISVTQSSPAKPVNGIVRDKKLQITGLGQEL